MTPVTKKHQQLILLEPEQAELLDELHIETRIPKQVLFREAVTDLLVKHGKGRKLDSAVATRVSQELRDKIAKSRHRLVKPPKRKTRAVS